MTKLSDKGTALSNTIKATLLDTDNHTDGITNGVYTLAERSKLTSVASNADVSPVTSVAGKSGIVMLVKADVGLALADNTADASKPVSGPQQIALNGKEASLGNPTATGYILSSTIAGVRSWVAKAVGVFLNVAQSWTAAQRVIPVALTDAATITMNASLSNNFTVTLAGNRTLGLPTNLVAGQGGAIKILQDATGTRTLAYNTVWKFDGGTVPTLTITANAVDRLDYFVWSATEIHASLALDVKLTIVFYLNLLGLSDTYGNVGSFVRNSTATVLDYLGVLKTMPINEHRVSRGRAVENAVRFSEDMTNPNWTKIRNALAPAPDTLTFTPAASNAWAQYDAVYKDSDYQVGVTGKFRFEVKGVPGETVQIWVSSDGIVNANSSKVITLTNQYVLYELEVQASYSPMVTWWPNIYFARQLAQTVTTMNIRNVQVAYTGEGVSYVPEYVPRLTSARAVGYFDRTSSLVIDANQVVTDTVYTRNIGKAILVGSKGWVITDGGLV